MAAKTSPAREIGADFHVVAARKVAYRAANGAASATFAVDTEHDAVVTRGTHVSSETPVLMTIDGTARAGLPAPAVGAAISGEVITLAEIVSLLSDAQLSKLAELIGKRLG